jgi:DNA-binding beta-propeller fold protein YncE
VTTLRHIACFDLLTDHLLWDKQPEGGCDRLAISPDGRRLFVPSFEGPHWNVLDAATGETTAKIVTNSGAHNTIYADDGRRVYLAGIHSPLLSIADPASNQVVKTIGPFSNSIRPFTVNAAQTRCYVNVNELLGFEVGNVTTGKMLHRVVVRGVSPGLVKRHGCPSHGIGLTPDEKEVWVVDAFNERVHVFDATVMPPKYATSVTTPAPTPVATIAGRIDASVRPTVAQYTTVETSATASATKATRPGRVARVSGGRNTKATPIRIAASPALNRKNFTPASRETQASVMMMPTPRCARNRKRITRRIADFELLIDDWLL